MSHTPGPWWVGDGHSEVFGPCIMAEGVHEMDALAAVDAITSHDPDADARLIAAAPDLLGALASLVHRLNEVRWPNEAGWLFAEEQVDAARAAIAKGGAG